MEQKKGLGQWRNGQNGSNPRRYMEQKMHVGTWQFAQARSNPRMYMEQKGISVHRHYRSIRDAYVRFGVRLQIKTVLEPPLQRSKKRQRFSLW